jgi:hypothetical protein
MTEFKNKYNFNIKDLEINKEKILHENNPFKSYRYRVKVLENDSFYIIKTLKLNQIEKRKIEIDNKTHHDVLKMKIKLNFRMFKIFLDNFYKDEFTNSRRSVYFLFTFPFLVGLGYYIISPLHPARGIMFNVSLLSSMMLLAYYFQSDIESMILSDSPLGGEVRFP